MTTKRLLRIRNFLTVILVSITTVVYADNPFPNIEGHWFSKILGLVSIIVTTFGLANNNTKQAIFGFCILLGAMLLAFDYYIFANIIFILGVIVLFFNKKILDRIIKDKN